MDLEKIVTREPIRPYEAGGKIPWHEPGFSEAIDYVSVQDALLRSWKSEHWEKVDRLAL